MTNPAQGATRIVSELTDWLVQPEYDCPGDTPIVAGYQCLACKSTASFEDELAHTEACVVTRVAALRAACQAAEESLSEVDAMIDDKRHDLGIIVDEGVMYREGKASDDLGWSHIRDWKTKRDAVLAQLHQALKETP